MAGNGGQWQVLSQNGGGLPILTTQHMQDHMVFGLVGTALTRCYHRLPCLHSESPPVLDLYQPPPPAGGIDDYVLCYVGL